MTVLNIVEKQLQSSLQTTVFASKSYNKFQSSRKPVFLRLWHILHSIAVSLLFIPFKLGTALCGV